jgi:hypothetical protein
MSVYEKKSTQRKGNNKKTGQAHQNTTAWKPNKNSKKTRIINALPVYGLCDRCTEVILWRKKYKKYKPLTAPKKWYLTYNVKCSKVDTMLMLLCFPVPAANKSRSKKLTMFFVMIVRPRKKFVLNV